MGETWKAHDEMVANKFDDYTQWREKKPLYQLSLRTLQICGKKRSIPGDRENLDDRKRIK